MDSVKALLNREMNVRSSEKYSARSRFGKEMLHDKMLHDNNMA